MNRLLSRITLPLVAIISMGGSIVSNKCVFGEGAEFLIITYDGYYDQACSLAEWKYSKGIQTEVTKLTDINPSGTPTRDEIKAYIVSAYNTWDPPPRYVLLLGDVTKIDKWTATNVFCTDNQYGDMEGDFHAEISVGRFAADNLDKCKTVIAKALCYERDPLRSGSDWVHHATLILNDESGSGWFPYYETCNYINSFLNDYWSPPPPEEWVDYFIWTFQVGGDDREDVIEAVNSGRQLIVYRGPGAPTVWVDPFNFSPEQRLTNEWKLPIVISGTCYHGNFSQSSLMCNTWLHAGTEVHPKGAVAFIGTSIIVDSYESSMNRQ